MKPHVKARREHNRRLGEADAALRCAFCRQALPALAVVRWQDGKKFCSDEHLRDFEEIERMANS